MRRVSKLTVNSVKSIYIPSNLTSIDTEFNLLFNNVQLGTAVKIIVVLLTPCESRISMNDTHASI